MAQKPEIILKEQPDIVDAIFQHGDTLHAHAKGKAGNFLRIIADELKNRRIDHAGAENFEPAAGFADPAGLSRLFARRRRKSRIEYRSQRSAR